MWQWLYNPTERHPVSGQLAGLDRLPVRPDHRPQERHLGHHHHRYVASPPASRWRCSSPASARSIADIIKAASDRRRQLTFRTYRKVILPTITPIFLAVAVVLLQVAIKTFDLAVALTNSGPGISTTFPATYVYDFMFQRGEIGEGAAAAMMVLAALAIVLVPYSLYLAWRRRERGPQWLTLSFMLASSKPRKPRRQPPPR